MSDGPVVLLRDLGQTEGPERSGNLVSADADWAEIDLTDGGAPISVGTLIGFQTSQTLYVGRVDSGEGPGRSQRLRVQIDHWLALQDVASIQKLWNQEQAD